MSQVARSISEHLVMISWLKKAAGHSPFQYGAYLNAARIINTMDVNDDFDWITISGVGSAIDKEIREFLKMGHHTTAWLKYKSEVMEDYIPRWYLEEKILEIESRLSGYGRLEFCGSYRRQCPYSRDLDVITTIPMAIVQERLADIAEIKYGADKRIRLVLKKCGYGLEIDFKLTTDESWSYSLLHYTGSMASNIRLRGVAKYKGLQLNEYGLFNRETNESVGVASTEEEIFRQLGEVYVEPMFR